MSHPNRLDLSGQGRHLEDEGHRWRVRASMGPSSGADVKGVRVPSRGFPSMEFRSVVGSVAFSCLDRNKLRSLFSATVAGFRGKVPGKTSDRNWLFPGRHVVVLGKAIYGELKPPDANSDFETCR